MAFVADAGNRRVVALALGYQCRCVKWLGTLDGLESGKRLANPYDVAWDPAGTWTLADDRIFIADTENHRIVAYQVNVNPAAGTMSKKYLNSFGTRGSGADQLLWPTGIAVSTSLNGSLFSNIYIADRGNRRVSLWYYDSGVSSVPDTATYSAYRSATMAGADLMDITVDAYGDVMVADLANRKLIRLKGQENTALTVLKTYGGGTTWASGSFLDPSSVQVVYQYTKDAVGRFVTTALPYVYTTEWWGDTTGIQLHRLGVDADNLKGSSAGGGAKSATISWLLTAPGSYTLAIRTLGGAVVRSYPAVVATSGWKSRFWDGRNNNGQVMPYGTYIAAVATESAYNYDVNQPRTVTTTFTLDAPMSVSINGPETVTKGSSATYSASVSGGKSPFTYQWKKGTTVVGTSSSYRYTASTCELFTLTLRVTDATAFSATSALDVQVTGGNPPCAQ